VTDKLITANARTVSGAEFFRHVFGIPEPTPEETERKAREAKEFWARRKAEDEELTELYRQRTADIIAHLRAKREQLTETIGDPMLRRFG
jgi:hypothetical protein